MHTTSVIALPETEIRDAFQGLPRQAWVVQAQVLGMIGDLDAVDDSELELIQLAVEERVGSALQLPL